MNTSAQTGFEIHIDAQPQIDLEAAAAWVRSTVEADIAKVNAQYDAAYRAETRLAEDLEARARQEGRYPEGSHVDVLIDIHRRALEPVDINVRQQPVTLTHLSEYGVLRQPLPAGTGPTYVKPVPFSSESEEQRDQGTGMSFADRGSGTMWVRFETGGLMDWEWARCSLGQIVKVPKTTNLLSPTFDFRLIGDSVTAWGLFCNADAELDLHVHTFNVTKNNYWNARRQIGRVVNMWIGTVGQTFNLPQFFSASGYGEADAGDTVIVTATLIGRAKSPTGRAGMNVELELNRLSIFGP